MSDAGDAGDEERRQRAALEQRYRLLHGSDREAARAELARLRDAGCEVVIVSACLLGIPCRFDGRDKRAEAAVAKQTPGAEILPLCPEVLAGFGVPRPSITLSADDRSASDQHGRDVTRALAEGARLADLFASEAGATRALLKERSPSCGTKQVHSPEGLRPGQGRFAARLSRRHLPVVSEEE